MWARLVTIKLWSPHMTHDAPHDVLDLLSVRTRAVRANSMDFGILEAGMTGPLALCLHGFPDSAYTWRYLLPELAGAGFHAVAPFMRGYAPSEVPSDGCYGVGALVADVIALHEALEGDEQSVLIGHDFGAEAAYGAVAFAPNRWRRLVTLSVPPSALDPVLFSDFAQLKRFFYLFLFRDSHVAAHDIVAANGMEFIDQLWREWSPGYDATDHLVQVKESLHASANLMAAIAYYAASAVGAPLDSGTPYLKEEQAAWRQADRPTLYLHGSADGCIGAHLVEGAADMLAPESRFEMVQDVGHFLHLESPDEVNRRILDWVAP
jgi:pimeloyl-ACP methyl ester carboxylesterase